MAFEMNTLAGFMALGPQVQPDRVNAVQIIERGPHGRRLAADPVAERRGRPRGSGFRFWVEEMGIPANESWNPPQRVIGLMGLGSTGSSYLDAMIKHATAMGVTPHEVSSFANTDSSTFMALAGNVFPNLPALDSGLTEIEVLVTKVHDVRTGRAIKSLISLAREANQQLGGGNSAARRKKRLDQLQFRVMFKRKDLGDTAAPSPSTTVVDPRTGKAKVLTEAQYCAKNPLADGCRPLGVSRPGGECASWDLYCRGKQAAGRGDLWKYVIGGAVIVTGVIMLSSFAGGFGRGLGGR